MKISNIQSPSDDVDSVPILQALCTAFFPNLAKRQKGRKVFYQYSVNRGINNNVNVTTEGGFLSLFLHPSNSLTTILENPGSRSGEIEWVM
jgi:ATP-dependent RNA helicase DHX8/PRP22